MAQLAAILRTRTTNSVSRIITPLQKDVTGAPYSTVFGGGLIRNILGCKYGTLAGYPPMVSRINTPAQPGRIGLSLDKGCAKGAPTAEMRTSGGTCNGFWGGVLIRDNLGCKYGTLAGYPPIIMSRINTPAQPGRIGLSLDKGCAKGAPTAEMRTSGGTCNGFFWGG